MRRRGSTPGPTRPEQEGRSRSGSESMVGAPKPGRVAALRAAIKTAHEDVFLQDRQVERRQELSDMTRRAKSGSGIQGHEMDLAGYMMRLSSDKRATGGADLDNLRDAHRTVVETRQKLSSGRGNVTTDIQKSGHKSSRLMVIGRDIGAHLRDKEGADPFASGAASAEFVRAGNCQEHGDVSTHSHATRLRSGQRIDTVSWTKGDHVWSELQTGSQRGGRDVILDAWAEGPAVFRDDAYFARKPSHSKSQYGYDTVSGPEAAAKLSQIKEHLRQDPKYRAFGRKRLSEMKKTKFKLHDDSTFLPTSVLDHDFVKRSDRVMDKTAKLGLERWKRPTGVTRADMARPVDTLQRVDLRNQIRAVGVARSLGENIAGAVQKAPDIVRAAKALKD